MFVYMFDAFGVLAGPVALPAVPGLGYQLPSNAVELTEALSVPAAGYVWAVVDGEVVRIEDCRGKYFSVADGRPVEHTALGPLPSDLATEPRPSEYHVWQAGGWVLDQAAQTEALRVAALQRRDQCLNEASTRIFPLQYSVDLGMSTPEEEASLLEWKRYSVKLNRIQQAPGFPISVEWPELPAEPQ